MKVFISSVRRGLEEERDSLPGLLDALGHEPIRFEDFTATGVPSRQACLDGVSTADAYILLLGRHYGERLSDTGKAPTEEELTVARRRGIPVLAFRHIGHEPDRDQAEFVRRVEDYSSGVFRGSFSSTHELLIAVADALRNVASKRGRLRWTRLDTEVAEPAWIVEPSNSGLFQGGSVILEVHALPVGEVERLPVRDLDEVGHRLARIARDQGVFSSVDALSIELSDRAVVVQLPPLSGTRRGLRINRERAVTHWVELPRDTLGTIIDSSDLQDRIEQLVRNIGEISITDRDVALAASLAPLDFTSEGSIDDLGRRSGASVGIHGDAAARVLPEDAVPSDALIPGAREVAVEFAARLVHAYRRARRL